MSWQTSIWNQAEGGKKDQGQKAKTGSSLLVGGQHTEQGSEREAGLQAQYARCSLTRRSSGSSNGMPPGPEARYGVHFLSSGPGGTPLLSPLAPTLGLTIDVSPLYARPGTVNHVLFCRSGTELPTWHTERGFSTHSAGTRGRETQGLFGTAELDGPRLHMEFRRRRQRAGSHRSLEGSSCEPGKASEGNP
jgi:hypothetical protein